MSAIDTSMTLGSIVTANPSLARELERRRLDYCCGGSRTLAEACAAEGLDAAAVAANLSRASEPPESAPWSTMDMRELVDHIEGTHHHYLWEELPRLDALLEKVDGVHGARHPELGTVRDLFAALRADLEPHLAKEERVLFPMIRELAVATTRPTFHCGDLRNPISVMMREHDAAGAILERMRAATNDYRVPDDGCTSYRTCFDGLSALEADTHLHVHKENNLLFPMVVHREEALAE
jgi:regulator of cell morphogenesis and NO signaling